MWDASKDVIRQWSDSSRVTDHVNSIDAWDDLKGFMSGIVGNLETARALSKINESLTSPLFWRSETHFAMAYSETHFAMAYDVTAAPWYKGVVINATYARYPVFMTLHDSFRTHLEDCVYKRNYCFKGTIDGLISMGWAYHALSHPDGITNMLMFEPDDWYDATRYMDSHDVARAIRAYARRNRDRFESIMDGLDEAFRMAGALYPYLRLASMRAWDMNRLECLLSVALGCADVEYFVRDE